jgi:phosphoadenosine phosphosulfate reductase
MTRSSENISSDTELSSHSSDDVLNIVSKDEIRDLNEKFDGAEPHVILEWLWKEFGDKAVLGTGFGPSGVLLTHLVAKSGLGIPIFYLDTGLFFNQTYELRDELEREFDLRFVRVSTELSLEDQEKEYGSELWKRNPNKCCFLRKVLPLKKYLSDKSVWITGVRRSQSDSRTNARLFEWDPLNEVLKVNPLVAWTSEEVWTYINLNELPYNPLHDEGYPSIGCIPCTHPVRPGDHERAGRWIGLDKTECGIHLPTQADNK